jgi:hypothetical protein
METISATGADYRRREIELGTPSHVDRCVRQIAGCIHLPFRWLVDHVLLEPVEHGDVSAIPALSEIAEATGAAEAAA